MAKYVLCDLQIAKHLKNLEAESLIKHCLRDSVVDFFFTFPPVCLFATFPHVSAGAMLPQGGAGALRCHEAIRQSGGTDGTWQIHREPCVLVYGSCGQFLVEHPASYAEQIWKLLVFVFILFITSSLKILPKVSLLRK